MKMWGIYRIDKNNNGLRRGVINPYYLNFQYSNATHFLIYSYCFKKYRLLS